MHRNRDGIMLLSCVMESEFPSQKGGDRMLVRLTARRRGWLQRRSEILLTDAAVSDAQGVHSGKH